MNNDIYAAVAGIDEKYTAQAENLGEIKKSFASRRKKIASAAAAAVACAGVITAVAILPPGTGRAPSTDEPSVVTTQAPLSENVITVPLRIFEPKTDPDSDAFGEDQIHETTIVADGMTYAQADGEALARYGVTQGVPESAFGEYVGSAVELFPDVHVKASVGSQDPSLTGADVYYYAPALCRAVVIAKKDGACSLFEVTGALAGRPFAESFAFYGASSPAGIASVSYTVSEPRGALYVTTETGEITDPDAVARVWEALAALTPEQSPENALSGSPQWFVNAMEDCREHPENHKIESIDIEILFANGCVLRGVNFLPYVGGGYVNGMAELTAEQNAALTKALLG